MSVAFRTRLCFRSRRRSDCAAISNWCSSVCNDARRRPNRRSRLSVWHSSAASSCEPSDNAIDSLCAGAVSGNLEHMPLQVDLAIHLRRLHSNRRHDASDVDSQPVLAADSPVSFLITGLDMMPYLAPLAAASGGTGSSRGLGAETKTTAPNAAAVTAIYELYAIVEQASTSLNVASFAGHSPAASAFVKHPRPGAWYLSSI